MSATTRDETCEVEGCEVPGYVRLPGAVRPARAVPPGATEGLPNAWATPDPVPAPDDGATGAVVVCRNHLVRLSCDGRVPDGESVRLAGVTR